MKQYKTVNNLIGWITFIIAATVYCMTIEPTAMMNVIQPIRLFTVLYCFIRMKFVIILF